MCVCVLHTVIICFIINNSVKQLFCSLLPSFARLKASFSNTIESSLENTKRCPYSAVLCVLTRRQLAEKYEMAAIAYKICREQHAGSAAQRSAAQPKAAAAAAAAQR